MRKCSAAARYILQDVHICTFGPSGPTSAATWRWLMPASASRSISASRSAVPERRLPTRPSAEVPAAPTPRKRQRRTRTSISPPEWTPSPPRPRVQAPTTRKRPRRARSRQTAPSLTAMLGLEWLFPPAPKPRRRLRPKRRYPVAPPHIPRRAPSPVRRPRAPTLSRERSRPPARPPMRRAPGEIAALIAQAQDADARVKKAKAEIAEAQRRRREQDTQAAEAHRRHHRRHHRHGRFRNHSVSLIQATRRQPRSQRPRRPRRRPSHLHRGHCRRSTSTPGQIPTRSATNCLPTFVTSSRPRPIGPKAKAGRANATATTATRGDNPSSRAPAGASASEDHERGGANRDAARRPNASAVAGRSADYVSSPVSWSTSGSSSSPRPSMRSLNRQREVFKATAAFWC